MKGHDVLETNAKDPWARAPKVPVEEVELVDAPPEALGTVSAKEDSAENTPVEFKKEEMLPLLDQLLQNGYIIDEFKLRSTPVVLRSRFAWEDQEIFSRLDAEKLNTTIAYQQRMQMYTLAGGLVQYGGAVFKPVNVIDKKDFDERLEFMLSLPTPIVDMIYQRWFKLNAKSSYLSTHIDDLLKDF